MLLCRRGLNVAREMPPSFSHIWQMTLRSSEMGFIRSRRQSVGFLTCISCVFRPRSEPSLERMKVGMAPLTLTRPVDQVAGPEPHHRSHADIVLSPTPPPRAGPPAAVQPPWQQPAAGRARATVAMSPQPVPVVPAPPPARTAISPVVAPPPARRSPRPPTEPPKQSDLLAYIRDEEK